MAAYDDEREDDLTLDAELDYIYFDELEAEEAEAYREQHDTDEREEDQREAAAEEARAILADLASVLNGPAPLEECPYTLQAETVRSTPAVQPDLFEE